MNRNPSMSGLASLVQSRGRNGDSVLVHMTPGEVKGLQALALAHGGQLSVNPETGLYEANFLKKLLPTIIGAVLTPLTGGLINPLTAGFLVGGVEAARTGDLGKGLMAGLGAYGGAGLGSALSGVGAAATDASTKMLAQEAAQNLGKEAGAKAAQEAVTSQIKTMAGTPSFSNIGAGIKEIATGGQNLGLGGFGAVKALGSTMGMPAISGLGMNVANAGTPDFEQPDLSSTIDPSYYESYGYDTGQGRFLGGQWRGNYPGFPRPPGMAEGGVIPAPNGNYPLARPSNSVGGYEIDVDPYTGEERFADGGSVGNNQNLEAYYQSLLAPPVQQGGGGQDFANYMQGLNKFVTSPVAAPTPPAQQPPPAGMLPPGVGAPVAGGGRPPVSQPPNARFPYREGYGFNEGDSFLSTGEAYGGNEGAMRWDANQGRFVSDAPQAPFSAGNMPTGNPFSGFGNIDFSALQNMFSGAGSELLSQQFSPFQERLGRIESRLEQPLVEEFDYSRIPSYTPPDLSLIEERLAAIENKPAPTSTAPEFDYSRIPSYTPPDLSGIEERISALQSGLGNLQNRPVPEFDYSRIPSYTPPDLSGITERLAAIESRPQPEFDYSRIPNFDINPFATRLSGIEERLGNLPQPTAPDLSGLESRFGDIQSQLGKLQSNIPQAPDLSGIYNRFGELESRLSNIPTTDLSGLQSQISGLEQRFQNLPAPVVNTPAFDLSPIQTQIQQLQSGIGALQNRPQPTFDTSALEQRLAAIEGRSAPQISFDPIMERLSSLENMLSSQRSSAPSAPSYQTQFSQEISPTDMGGFGGGFAAGGPVQYAAGGKFLRGPGDGMSDDIKANINGEQEARLADGEFVIPADVVSHIGNGSSEAGADRLHVMMDRIRKARTGRTRQAPEIDSDKYLPA